MRWSVLASSSLYGSCLASVHRIRGTPQESADWEAGRLCGSSVRRSPSRLLPLVGRYGVVIDAGARSALNIALVRSLARRMWRAPPSGHAGWRSSLAGTPHLVLRAARGTQRSRARGGRGCRIGSGTCSALNMCRCCLGLAHRPGPSVTKHNLAPRPCSALNTRLARRAFTEARPGSRLAPANRGRCRRGCRRATISASVAL